MNTFTFSLCCSRAMDGAFFLRYTRLPAHSVWGPKRSLFLSFLTVWHFYQAASSDNEGLLPQKQCQARRVWHIRQLPSWQLTFPSNNHQQVETGPLQNKIPFKRSHVPIPWLSEGKQITMKHHESSSARAGFLFRSTMSSLVIRILKNVKRSETLVTLHKTNLHIPIHIPP